MSAPLPPVPKVLRIQFFQGDDADLHVLNTLHYSYSGVADQIDTDTVAERAETGWETNILPQQSPGMTLKQVVVTDLSTSSSPQSTVVSGAVGTSTTPSVPAGVAAVIQLPIARRYRGGKPRMYLAGLPSSATINAQTWHPTVVANVSAAMVSLDSAIETGALPTLGQLEMVNVSYFSGFSVVTNPITGRAKNVPRLRVGGPITDVIFIPRMSSKIGSQRRRNLQSS